MEWYTQGAPSYKPKQPGLPRPFCCWESYQWPDDAGLRPAQLHEPVLQTRLGRRRFRVYPQDGLPYFWKLAERPALDEAKTPYDVAELLRW